MCVLAVGPDVPLLLPALLRHGGQDRPDGAAELPAGLQWSPGQTLVSHMATSPVFIL